MKNTSEHAPEVAVIGGDGRGADRWTDSASIRVFASPRYAGNGSLRRAIAAIDGGRIGLVLLLVRWLGHSDFRRIVAACRDGDVPFVLVPGGLSSARRILGEVLAEGVQHAG